MSSFTAWRFDGHTYVPALDQERLSLQMARVLIVTRAWGRRRDPDQNWFTLAHLAHATAGSEAGVSARLRDLRKERWGCQRVDRRRHPSAPGLFLYRVSFDNPAALPRLDVLDHAPVAVLRGDEPALDHDRSDVWGWPRFPKLEVVR
jgi:hypothetical protein